MQARMTRSSSRTRDGTRAAPTALSARCSAERDGSGVALGCARRSWLHAAATFGFAPPLVRRACGHSRRTLARVNRDLARLLLDAVVRRSAIRSIHREVNDLVDVMPFEHRREVVERQRE